jgi:hypothetical protein
MKYKLTHKTTYTMYTDAIHNYQCIVCLHPITQKGKIVKILINNRTQSSKFILCERIILVTLNIIFQF